MRKDRAGALWRRTHVALLRPFVPIFSICSIRRSPSFKLDVSLRGCANSVRDASSPRAISTSAWCSCRLDFPLLRLARLDMSEGRSQLDSEDLENDTLTQLATVLRLPTARERFRVHLTRPALGLLIRALGLFLGRAPFFRGGSESQRTVLALRPPVVPAFDLRFRVP